ncbi:MAG: CopG family antitoxin [Cyanobacteria bacterium P01_E01_bin.42]
MANEKDIKKNHLPNSQELAKTYDELGDRWSDRDMSEYWDRCDPVEFQVHFKVEGGKVYYEIEKELYQQLLDLAGKQGISVSDLVNSWIQEKLASVRTLTK